MAVIPALPKTWANGDILTHSDLNNSFTTIRDAVNTSALFKDVSSQTVTVAVTWSAAQTFSSTINVTGILTLNDAASRIVPGSTSLSLRDNANSADNVLVSDAGVVTIRAGLVMTAGTITGTLAAGAQTGITGLGTLTALTIGGDLTFTGASRQIIPGTTGFAVRNLANTANAYAVGAGGITVGNTGEDSFLGSVSATTASTGFAVLSTISGTPTGGPSNGAMIWDTTGKKFWIKDSTGWLGVVLS